ncbi:MAG TPA: hypothetical protein VLI05_01640 [Candidatus Saccharimonadia bacterium]|nr:hypothetical protein [Candidatus Saccharimonadia bacterium]
MSGCDCCDDGGSDLGFTDEHEYDEGGACLPDCSACKRELGQGSGLDNPWVIAAIVFAVVLLVAIVGAVAAAHTNVPANWR